MRRRTWISLLDALGYLVWGFGWVVVPGEAETPPSRKWPATSSEFGIDGVQRTAPIVSSGEASRSHGFHLCGFDGTTGVVDAKYHVRERLRCDGEVAFARRSIHAKAH